MQGAGHTNGDVTSISMANTTVYNPPRTFRDTTNERLGDLLVRNQPLQNPVGHSSTRTHMGSS